jgi:hypothetical protein
VKAADRLTFAIIFLKTAAETTGSPLFPSHDMLNRLGLLLLLILDQILLNILHTTLPLQVDCRILHNFTPMSTTATICTLNDTQVYPDPMNEESFIHSRGHIIVRKAVLLQCIHRRPANALQ